MIIDSSAVMAILLQEPGADAFSHAIADADAPRVSAATLVELGATCVRRGGAPLLHQLRILMIEAAIDVETVASDLAWSAIDAYRRFGRGTGDPPCLNFGDCFSYALAKERDEPLLYKGEDFAKTDVRSAL